MHDVLRFWLDRGVDGFRIDVVHKLAKDPELGDNQPELRHDEDWPTIHNRLRRLRAVVDAYEDRMLVGEVYLKDLRRVVQYINSGDELDLAHNFVFVHLPWDAQAMRASVEDFDQLAEEAAWPAWFLANHDHPRVASRYADGSSPGSGERRARVAAMLICTLRGTPFIYQGEELGLPNAECPPGSEVDVDGRDPERAPIPWEAPSQAGPAAGFTTGKPWLPLPPDAERLSVLSQRDDPNSTLHLVRRILQLRAREPALQGGAQTTIDVAPGVFCYVRDLEGTRFAVALNFTSERVPCDLGEPFLLELSTCPAREPGGIDMLEPDEGVILRLDGPM
jgi:alpha-glucosidase